MAQNLSRYSGRRRTSNIVLALCWGSAILGITILFIILTMLIVNGVSALSLNVFTEDLPPPGVTTGGLRNAIVGSLLMTVTATLIGTPIGVLAGTYMAEYGRHSKLTAIVRFVNDILLSAPSIIIGVFVATLIVQTTHTFSGAAGALALAILVIPIVVRTTENMLLLVPNQLREAASALGLPRSVVIRRVTYKAARAGMMTGILLAVARISGETAPLLFTSLGNSSFNVDPRAPMESLPTVINKFAGSADGHWQQLAWAGAFLITFAVLLLSVFARWLGSKSE